MQNQNDAPAVSPAVSAAVWLSSSEAAARLGVSLPTLYSYVSRGLLHPRPASEMTPEMSVQSTGMARPSGRAKFYRRSEVDRLARRHAAAREPRSAARATLDFGLPVLASGLCLIEQGRFHYRGLDVLDLAEHATLEDAAALLWSCDRQALAQHAMRPAPAWLGQGPRAPPPATPQAMPRHLRACFGQIVTQAAWVPPPAGERAAHWSLVQAMLVAATGQRPAPGNAPLHRQLAAAWGLKAGQADQLRRALVLAADHELNASSFTARCVASTGADADAAVTAALAALSGPRHGAMSVDLEALWPQALAAARSAPRLAAWLAGRRQLPGFGHALYPEGDPRATALLASLPPDRVRDRLVQAVHQHIGRAPNLDFGLVALVRALKAPPGAAFALFAIARCVGWLAHVFEQQAQGSLIRPRAAYVGLRPVADAPPVSTGRVIRRR